MADKILLNNENYFAGEEDLPCLITYAPKTGGSHFSVTLVTNLFLNGSKILFFTAYPMAKDNFFEQINGMEDRVVYIESVDQLEANKNAQVVILKSGDEKLFLEIAPKLADINERVVLVKNIEVFSDAVFDYCSKLQKVIFSGDIDKCGAKDKIIAKGYKTIVAFSKPEFSLPFKLPALEKYDGYLWSEKKSGLVKVEKNTL